MALPEPVTPNTVTYVFQIQKDNLTPAVEAALDLLKEHMFHVVNSEPLRELQSPPSPATLSFAHPTPKNTRLTRIHVDKYPKLPQKMFHGDIVNINSMPFTIYSQSLFRTVFVCHKCVLENKNTNFWESCSLAVLKKVGADVVKRCTHRYEEMFFDDDAPDEDDEDDEEDDAVLLPSDEDTDDE